VVTGSSATGIDLAVAAVVAAVAAAVAAVVAAVAVRCLCPLLHSSLVAAALALLSPLRCSRDLLRMQGKCSFAITINNK